MDLQSGCSVILVSPSVSDQDNEEEHQEHLDFVNRVKAQEKLPSNHPKQLPLTFILNHNENKKSRRKRKGGGGSRRVASINGKLFH